jgi:hypothetical protein
LQQCYTFYVEDDDDVTCYAIKRYVHVFEEGDKSNLFDHTHSSWSRAAVERNRKAITKMAQNLDAFDATVSISKLPIFRFNVFSLTLFLAICLTKGAGGVIGCTLRESTTTWRGGVR